MNGESMKKLTVVVLLLLVVGLPTLAADIVDTQSVESSLPRDARDSLGGLTPASGDVQGGVKSLWNSALGLFKNHAKSASGMAFAMVAVCALVGLVTSFAGSTGSSLPAQTTDIASVCALVVLCFSSMGSLLADCTKAIEGLSLFNKALIPAFAAATAVAGKPASAVASAGATVLFSSVLVELALKVFLPGVYLYIGAVAAGLISKQDVLTRVAGLLKWSRVSF